MNAPVPASPAKIWVHRIHSLLIVAFVSSWTVALLSPVPMDSARKVLNDDGIFLFSKFLHFSAYAFLMVLCGTHRLMRNHWTWLVVFLVVHGELTEYIQQFVGRHMSVRDALIDSAGVLIGAVIVGYWWRSRESRS